VRYSFLNIIIRIKIDNLAYLRISPCPPSLTAVTAVIVIAVQSQLWGGGGGGGGGAVAGKPKSLNLCVRAGGGVRGKQ
jgi:hypothetical protein